MVTPDEAPPAPANGARTAARVGALALVAAVGTLAAFAWTELNPPGSAHAALDVLRETGSRLLAELDGSTRPPTRPVIVRPAADGGDGPTLGGRADDPSGHEPAVAAPEAAVAAGPPVVVEPAVERELRATREERCARLCRRADDLARSGRTTHAIGVYEEVLELDPDEENAHYGLVMTNVRLGRVEKAREHLARLRALDPSLASLAANVVR